MTALARELDQQAQVIVALKAQEGAIWRIGMAYASALKNGHTLLFCGNGGSYADAQHLAAEYVVRFKQDRPAMAAIALGAEGATLTACANDYDFTQVFARQVQAIGRPGDVLTCLTTSGTSPNVVNAAKAAHAGQMTVVAITGSRGFAVEADHWLAIPSRVTAHIQVASMVVGHHLVGQVESILGHSEKAA
jgi:D-sedoheptulose 7-phosphate isomerase